MSCTFCSDSSIRVHSPDPFLLFVLGEASLQDYAIVTLFEASTILRSVPETLTMCRVVYHLHQHKSQSPHSPRACPESLRTQAESYLIAEKKSSQHIISFYLHHAPSRTGAGP